MNQIPRSTNKISLSSINDVPRVELSQLTEYSPNEATLYYENVGRYRVDYLWQPNLSFSRLFVFFSGDAMRAKNDPPVFQRWSWSKYFPGSCLYISDPSLYLSKNIGLGWYSGTADFDPLNSIYNRIINIMEFLGIDEDRVIAYGSSGGGFASLRLSSISKDFRAIVINPQIRLKDYGTGCSTDRYTKLCFNGLDRFGVAELFPKRFDIIESLNDLITKKIIYIQNKLDEHHFSCHYKAFCASMGVKAEENLSTGNFRSIIYEHPNGHLATEPPEAFQKAIDIITNDFVV
jgi:hypothetical protein